MTSTAEIPLPRILAMRAEENADAVFLVDAGGAAVTYGETLRRVLRCVRELEECGVQRGDAVAALLETTTDAIVTWLALGVLGAVEVPLNLAYRGPQLAQLLRDSGARTIVAQPHHLAHLFESDRTGNDPVDRLIVLDRTGQFDPTTVPTACTVLPGAGVSPGDRASADVLTGLAGWDVACLLYTSGTTGRSKGVVVPWWQLHATAAGLLAELPAASDVAYVPAPLFHVGGKAPVYLMASVGGCAVLRAAFKTDEFWPDILAHGCTVTFLGAAMASFLLDDEATAPARDAHPLRDVLMAPLIPGIDRFVDRFGVRVCSAYNMTEISCPIVTGWTSRYDGSCGRLRPGYECRVVDDHDLPVADGDVGELVVRSDRPWVLAAGYWRNHEATASAWRNLWFHTGDLHRREGDRFFFVDRLKDAIRRRGENISSIELEELLAENPAVAEASAIGVPSRHGEEEVLAVVRLAEGCAASPAELHAEWRARLPRFMVPRYVEIMDELPRTANGKVMKSALRERGVGASTWEPSSSR